MFLYVDICMSWLLFFLFLALIYNALVFFNIGNFYNWYFLVFIFLCINVFCHFYFLRMVFLVLICFGIGIRCINIFIYWYVLVWYVLTFVCFHIVDVCFLHVDW